MYKVVFTKQALKDLENLKRRGIASKAKMLVDVIRENPYQNPPRYEKLVGDLEGILSRRINIQHRLVYQVHEGSFTEKDVRIISAQLILAIEHLHKKGIIYRDLKPDNILIDSEGYIKLADFGLCKDGIVGNFESKSFCGSVAYLPPEVINRTGHGRAVDWYLLGTVIYEMLVGFPPYFTTMGRAKLVDNIQNAQLKFYNRNLSSEVMNLIRGLLDRDITKRIGASLRDSQEIKEHPFYKGLNFECIYNKEFIPPKCLREKIESASKKRDESQWYCNKDLKNDMKINNENNNNQNIDNINIKENDAPNKQKIIMNKIDFAQENIKRICSIFLNIYTPSWSLFCFQ